MPGHSTEHLPVQSSHRPQAADTAQAASYDADPHHSQQVEVAGHRKGMVAPDLDQTVRNVHAQRRPVVVRAHGSGMRFRGRQLMLHGGHVVGSRRSLGQRASL